MNNFGIIIDGYSTGAGFAKEFLKFGISCIHVQSQITIPKVYSHTYVPKDYYVNYVFDGNLLSLVQVLQQYRPQFVIAGAECGVELADILCEKLYLPGNGTRLSSHRRNKYLMQEVVKSKGLQVIPSFKAATLDEAKIWAISQNTWPLIVKPLTSAGGEGVKICDNLQEVAMAYNSIMAAKINMLGFKNEAVILQHYIQGEEYVVNTVSQAKVHKFCELWRYTRYSRPNGCQIYDTARVIDIETKAHEEVVNFALEVVDALDIQYGPAHVEIIKNDRGCFLIEMGARLMGANLPFSLLARCITTAQAFFTIMIHVSPNHFKDKLFLPYNVMQPLVALFMVSNQNGIIKNIKFLDEIRLLKSFYDMKLSIGVGDRLRKTVDYQTAPGMIYLTHNDPEIIEADIFHIRKLESNMFELEAEKHTNEIERVIEL